MHPKRTGVQVAGFHGCFGENVISGIPYIDGEISGTQGNILVSANPSEIEIPCGATHNQMRFPGHSDA